MYSSKLFTYFIFADDTNLLASDKNLHTLIRKINNELTHVSSYFKANKLSLNVNKTNFMLFRNKHDNRRFPDFNIEIDNANITHVSNTKFLGVKLDERLTWKQHTTYIANIVSKYTGILYRLKPILPPMTLFMLYNSLVLPHIMYCNIIWGDHNNSFLGTVHIKQKKIIRICTNSPFLAHTPPLFADLNTLTIHDIHKLQIALFMFKFHNNLLPDIFLNYFTKTNSIHGYETRNSKLYRPRNFNTNLANNTIQRQGPLIWSSVPKYIRDSTSVLSFKMKLKAELISCYE
jgi:hypothetical protein